MSQKVKTTKINKPKKGSTTFKFNNKANSVVVTDPTKGYRLELLGGADTGVGSNGDDTLLGGSGQDVLEGGWGRDLLDAGASAAGVVDANQLLGDTELIRAAEVGGEDRLIGGVGCSDQLVGDSRTLYGIGGKDELIANGMFTEMIGDAVELQTSGRGGDDLLTGTPTAGTSTLMVGDAVKAYGTARCGNDQLVSGRSTDLMYGDYQYALPAQTINDPFIFEVYEQYSFFTPVSQGLQPFSFKPITSTLLQQDFNQATGGPPPEGPGTKVSFVSLQELGNQYGRDYQPEQALVNAPPPTVYIIPDQPLSPSSPTGGADQFIFRTFDEGNDIIFDFRPTEGDKIVFLNGLTKDDIGSRVLIQETARDTLITYGTSSILLPFFTDLNANDFLFGS